MSLEDNLYPFLKFYKNLPLPIKVIIGKLYSVLPSKLKYGEFYFRYKKRIIDKKECRDNLLKVQLKDATENIPFYKGLEYNSIEDFPIVDKTLIRSNFTSFIDSSRQDFIKANTGGTSGNPFEFYLESGVSRSKEKAHFNWYWGQFGYKEGDRILMIRGEALSGDQLYEYQAIDNKLAISCYLINASNIEQVIKEINKFKPKFIHAYPSALKIFIKCIDQNVLKLDVDVKSIFLGSEGLLLKDKNRFETYFNAKIAHWYGHSERLVHAGNCLYSDDFHIYPFYGYLELLDESNNVIIEAKLKGRIIATGFDNSVMPLIRYDTGDEAEYSETIECNCGFKGRSLRKIYGRGQDYIYLKDKTKISLTAFIFGQHFEEFELIKEIQLEQSTYGDLLIRIVTTSMADFKKDKFISKLKKSVEEKIEIELQFVSEIAKTKRGKQVFLIQKIKK
ncbi:MAG: phenylacetate--CoA ligase family protein [Flavobacteriaceae bacterium]|nr:phenylacetate--CoA ligase family protein [Flavobacteriaceae bacterium]